MRDRIVLTGVRARGRHGVLEQERRDGQDFVVDVTLGVDLRASAASDQLADTVDYAAIAREIVEVIEGEPVALLETLAATIVARCLADTRIDEVEVTVHKPQAPVGVPFGDVAVTVRRRRGEGSRW